MVDDDPNGLRRTPSLGIGVAAGWLLPGSSTHVEVVLAAVAVVAEVEDLMVGQAADGAIGVGPVGDVDPQRRAALAGITKVQLDGGWVVGDGADDPPGQGPLGQEPLVILQNLLAGIDPQVAIGEPLVPQRRLGKLSVASILKDDDQESLRVEGQRPST
jgi:hypothetical protein